MIKLHRADQWQEDVAPMASETLGQRFLGTAVSVGRSRVFVIIAAVIFSGLLVRVGYLQLWQGAAWRAVAEQNRLRLQPIIPERGIIFDAQQRPLVSNAPNFRLTLRAQDLPRDATAREKTIRALAQTINLPEDKLQQILQAFSRYKFSAVTIREGISYEEAVAVYLQSGQYPGLTIERGAKRYYAVGQPGALIAAPLSLSHVLGYVGRVSPEDLDRLSGQGYFPVDSVGKTGVEAAYESFLRGIPGQREVEVDAVGAEHRTTAVSDPTPGSDLTLTLDVAIQRELELALRNGVARAGVRSGAAVAVDPRDGSILGLVSLPAFDNNAFANFISSADYNKLINDPGQPLLNRAIAGQFPSGSTIKPFIAAAGLQEKVITPTSTVVSTGGVLVGKWFFGDWKEGGHGVTNVYKALADSVNTFFYLMGGGKNGEGGLGPERIKKYLEYFGFDRLTGVAIPGETAGFLPSPEWKEQQKGEPWYVGDTYNISIGQGDVLVTPLQMAMAVAAIANDGTLWKPRILAWRRTADKQIFATPAVVAAKVPVDSAWLEVVRAGMRQTVTSGSARSLNTLPIMVAGKTGTAQWSSQKAPHAWFTSFAPYANPEIVVVFFVEEGREGSAVCVPAAKEFYTWWAVYRAGKK